MGKAAGKSRLAQTFSQHGGAKSSYQWPETHPQASKTSVHHTCPRGERFLAWMLRSYVLTSQVIPLAHSRLLPPLESTHFNHYKDFVKMTSFSYESSKSNACQRIVRPRIIPAIMMLCQKAGTFAKEKEEGGTE